MEANQNMRRRRRLKGVGKIISIVLGVFFLCFLTIFPTSFVAASLSIMPLGDSITQGGASGAKPGEEVSYRKALRDKLAAAGFEVVFVGSQKSGEAIFANAAHEGHGGWCAKGCYQNQSDILRETYKFLTNNPPDIVLLHIGTNDISHNYDPQKIALAVGEILDEIARYGREQGRQIWVMLALIINRLDPPCIKCPQTTNFNRALRQIAQERIQKGNKIVLVDMEKGAGIDYRLFPLGNMWDLIHPHETGYQKMADVWFEGLKKILTPSRKTIYQALSKPDSAESPKPSAKEAPPLANLDSPIEKTEGYTIQINAFRDLNLAREFAETQKKKGQPAYWKEVNIQEDGVWYKVFIGLFSKKEEAALYLKEKKIREIFPHCFIQKLP